MARRVRPARRFACPQSGQATVEFALLLPLVMFLILAVLQTALIVRDYVATVHAAREAARAASVDRRPDAASSAARRVLRRADVIVGDRPAVGSPIRVEVTYTSDTDLPLVGAVFPDPVFHVTANDADRAVTRSERGGVAIFGLVIVVLAGLVLVGLGRAGVAAARSARAETAADAAALAAADALARHEGVVAARVAAVGSAADNGALLIRCDCGDDHAEVVVVIGDATGRARAEVDPCGGVGGC